MNRATWALRLYNAAKHNKEVRMMTIRDCEEAIDLSIKIGRLKALRKTLGEARTYNTQICIDGETSMLSIGSGSMAVIAQENIEAAYARLNELGVVSDT
jgi:hypothetical protein